MIVFRRAEEVEEWFVCFHKACDHRLSRLIPGRFKHVRAFAFSHGAQCWVFYDPGFSGGTRITLAPAGSIGDDLVGKYTRDAMVIKIMRQPNCKPFLAGRLGGCATAVRHLLNLPGGALLPGTLLRDCLRFGGSVVIDERPPATT